MKITIVQGAFLPIPAIMGGAVEKRWFLMAQEFAKQGHEVVHISKTHPGFDKKEYINGVLHIRIKGFMTPKNAILLKFYDLIYACRTLKNIQSDIVVTNTFWLPMLLRNKKKGAVCVDVARMPKGQMRFYKHVARLRANSSAVKNAIVEEASFLESKVKVIPNPLTFLTDNVVGVPKNKEKIILYVGRIHPEKGINILIEAFIKAEKKGLKGYQLKIIGPYKVNQGGGGDKYVEMLKKAALGNQNILFIDPIYDAEKLNKEYKTASIFAYPSLAEKGETFGIAPLEAMAWGCIPIVSNLDCFKDFIIAKKNGYIFDHRSESAIDEVVKYIFEIADLEKKESEMIRNNAIKVRETHSVLCISNMFLEDFKHMLNGEN
ncbi:glycosyltransferase family 4 protein [Wenyingzhuangia sp. 2_MG-2023]|uniref:glycosyltransferase family 4 protein n=1 Tax=Wenyingzhuangia sp. 2_MG-2023 TaxID=3062639 RepID=UPI0026E32BE4|nr:glycosyltransferase family 4 protein [Wenyingzhuangia sp. 2_MG-2023]MDO6739315.1 glycosyltransferase family 4 protein [Wenyingzhuangia sp. 2_MG-2023]